MEISHIKTSVLDIVSKKTCGDRVACKAIGTAHPSCTKAAKKPEMPINYKNSNVKGFSCREMPLHLPEYVQDFLCPVPQLVQKTVIGYRDRIVDMVNGQDPSVLIMASVEPTAHLASTSVLSEWVQSCQPESILAAITVDVPRVLDNSSWVGFRQSLIKLNEACPVVGNISNTIAPQYFADCFVLGVIDPTLIESQLHRELVSGLPFPVGFTVNDKTIQQGIDSMYASKQPHHYLSVSKTGVINAVGTIGNDDTFMIVPLTGDLQHQLQQISIIYETGVTGRRIVLKVGSIDPHDHIRLQMIRCLMKTGKVLGLMIEINDISSANSFIENLI